VADEERNGRIVLASASPRRRELLDAMGVPHEVVPSSVDESLIAADHPRTFAIRAAYAKALDVAARVAPGRLVLAADTVVTLDGVVYGKPASEAEAREMLGRLSGRRHEVITGVALARAGHAEVVLDSETTGVTFRTLGGKEVEEYLVLCEHLDKAGAYGIQGAAAAFVACLEGDYFNVMGLPCGRVARMLAEAGVEARPPVPPRRWMAG
jgi:septum formation protein